MGWKEFQDVFNCMPIAALIDDKILCMHGGLSPELVTVTQLQQITRPTEVPENGLLCDLLWSDPEKGQSSWGENDRGVSYTFGEAIIKSFLKKNYCGEFDNSGALMSVDDSLMCSFSILKSTDKGQKFGGRPKTPPNK